MKISDADFQTELAYLNSLDFRGIRLGLENSTELLAGLGNPHLAYRTVHVAGTNGKGSTCSMIAGIMSASGHKTGLFTSPHLHSFRERIEIDRADISKEKSVSLIREIREVANNRDVPVTYFEFLTILAFLYFARENVDIAVIEVGLGGRFDSTNVLKPALTVITSIDYDHEHLLGKSLSEIAFEKCGIIKKGVPLVCGVERAEIASFIEEQAKKKSAPFYLFQKDYSARRREPLPPCEVFDFSLGATSINRLKLPLIGTKQWHNGATAVAASLLLSDAIDEDVVRKGLSTVRIRGRFERGRRNRNMIFDGAHNPSAATALAETLMERFGKNSIDFIFGAMRDKNYGLMIKKLLPCARSFNIFSPNQPRSENPDVLQATLRSIDVGIPSQIFNSPDEIYSFVKRQRETATICVTGSFFTVADLIES